MGNSAPQTTKPYVDPAVIKCNTGYLTNTDCNADPLCYYINNGCYHKRQYSTLNNISSGEVSLSQVDYVSISLSSIGEEKSVRTRERVSNVF